MPDTCYMVKRYPTQTKLTFKAIVLDKDNWARYQSVYSERVTSHQIAEVEKMLKCGTPENGFATYICLHCGERERVCFSCKSRVCSSSVAILNFNEVWEKSGTSGKIR